MQHKHEKDIQSNPSKPYTHAICVFDKQSSCSSEPIDGIVRFQMDPKHVNACVVHIKLSGFEPGTVHGIHIHRYGDLTKKCESTCEHYNPHKKLHGSIAIHKSNRHAGDLCNNIQADDHGRVDFRYLDPLVKVRDIVGRSVVIHANRDDCGQFRIDTKKNANTVSNKSIESGKSGNAGKRIACAVIGLAS